MCLYPKRILNRRFMPNRKNGYNPPICTDERLRYINVECGKCYECRRKKAREWKVRIAEQLKETPQAIFFTGTFTDERIEKLSKKYDIPEKNVNELATREVRLFMERLRKYNNGKSIKHWIVTEKGHTNTRRIHIHGIFWHENKQQLSWLLKQQWIAGYSYQGTYVNMKTVNYIVKYMTKTDLDNPEFNGIILASPGLGKNFINSYDGKKIKYVKKNEIQRTIETYRLDNGQKIPLPKYYKYKLFTEEEKELLWIEKIEEGYSYVMGEKHSTKTDEEEKAFQKVVLYYRQLCAEVHKDNEERFNLQKNSRKMERKHNYIHKVREFKNQCIKKELNQQIRFDKDLNLFKEFYFGRSDGLSDSDIRLSAYSPTIPDALHFVTQY